MKSVSPFLGKACLLLTGTLIWLSATMPALAGQEIKTRHYPAGGHGSGPSQYPRHPPKAVLVMFPGGEGANVFKERGGQIRLGRNFWCEPRRGL